jgi:hypothetical protein
VERLHRLGHIPPVKPGEEIGSPPVRHVLAEYGGDMIAERVILAVVNFAMRVDRDGQIAFAAVGPIRFARKRAGRGSLKISSAVLVGHDDQGGAGFPPAALGIYAGSRILEIDPVKNQIVWQYTGGDSGRPVWSFYSSFVSSAQRLPNGNTLIDEGMDGPFFQITPDGDIVWEYVLPYPGKWTVGGKAILNSLVFRAQAVPYDWVPEGAAHSEAGCGSRCDQIPCSPMKMIATVGISDADSLNIAARRTDHGLSRLPRISFFDAARPHRLANTGV